MKRRKLLPRKTIFRADVSPVSQISTNERRSRKVCSSSLFVNGETEREREKERKRWFTPFDSSFSVTVVSLQQTSWKIFWIWKKKILFTKSIVISCSCFYNIIRKKSDERDEIRIRKGNELLLVEEEKYRNRIWTNCNYCNDNRSIVRFLFRPYIFSLSCQGTIHRYKIGPDLSTPFFIYKRILDVSGSLIENKSTRV